MLLGLTPDAVWLAFPLFFIELHVLPVRWGLAVAGVTTLLAIAGFAWHQHAVTPAAVIGPVIGAAVAVATVLGYQALYRESEQRRRLIDQLTAARGELAAAERAAGVLTERERLAREIHDTLAQGLSSIQLLLRAAERALPGQPGTAAQHVRHARTTAQENLAEARRFVRALTPPGLDGLSLPTALDRLCTSVAERSGLVAGFRVSGDPAAMPTPQEVALLRIAQSALANTVQHADASRVTVTLSFLVDEIALDVVDDGVGFVPGQVAAGDHADDAGGGFGLAAMRARALALGGTMTVESAPGRGTALAASFPRQRATALPGGPDTSPPGGPDEEAPVPT
ncbi:MAG: sensor histidine kinase [Streptosporangiaceae bacterium]